LVTQIAIVRGVRVPRARGLSPERAVLGRYRRRCAKVDHLIRDVFLRGVSTREVGEVLQELLGEPVSAATVSRVAAGLDREVDRFHQSPLGDDWRYLVLDGVYLRVRGATKVRRRLVLCAYGIGVDGERRLLDFRLADSESDAALAAHGGGEHMQAFGQRLPDIVDVSQIKVERLERLDGFVRESFAQAT
jgi:transposase-like protein